MSVRRGSRGPRGVDATNAILGVMTIGVLGLLGWCIATQVQVSRVSDRLSCLPNATFQNLTVSTFQIIQNVTSTTSPLFIGSAGIDTTAGTFFMTTRLDGTVSLSGGKLAILGVWASFTTNFVGDGLTIASITIDMSNSNGIPIELAQVFPFVQLPMILVGQNDNRAAPSSFLWNGPIPGIPTTQLQIAIIPGLNAPAQMYTSQYIEFALGDYVPA